MKTSKRNYLLLILVTAIPAVIFSQTSLYRGINPYVANSVTGEIVQVHVSSLFSVKVNGEWNRNIEVNLKLEPDKKNLSFLNSSEQSKNNNRKANEKQNINEKLTFSVSAILNQQADGTYRINANRIVNMDGKITRIVMTGIIDAKSIVNGNVNSDSIADLNLTIISQPQAVLDNSYNGSVSKTPDDNEGQAKAPDTKEEKAGGFSEEQTRKYVIEYMKEILGGLK